MNDKQRRRFERLSRAANFGASVSADFPGTGKGGQALASLTAAIAEAEAQDTSRATNLRAQQHGASSRKDARAALQSQLAAISDTADAISLDHPEVKDSFKRPRTNVNDQNLLSTARSFAAAAADPPLKARFVEYDMPADFLERLDAGIRSFDAAIDTQTTGANTRLASNAGLDDALKRAEQELEKFDAAVRNKFRSDPSRLAAWESARHLERAPRPNKKLTTTPPASPST